MAKITVGLVVVSLAVAAQAHSVAVAAALAVGNHYHLCMQDMVHIFQAKLYVCIHCMGGSAWNVNVPNICQNSFMENQCHWAIGMLCCNIVNFEIPTSRIPELLEVMSC